METFAVNRIRSDHNIDNSTAILKEWVRGVKPLYHHIDMKLEEKKIGRGSLLVLLVLTTATKNNEGGGGSRQKFVSVSKSKMLC